MLTELSEVTGKRGELKKQTKARFYYKGESLHTYQGGAASNSVPLQALGSSLGRYHNNCFHDNYRIRFIWSRMYKIYRLNMGQNLNKQRKKKHRGEILLS